MALQSGAWTAGLLRRGLERLGQTSRGVGEAGCLLAPVLVPVGRRARAGKAPFAVPGAALGG